MRLGIERDPVYGGWVRAGWVAQRQAYTDEAEADIKAGKNAGTCLACGLPVGDHPMPARLWRSDPGLCAAARNKEDETA